MVVEEPPRGSLRYFAVLFAPADKRSLLEALYAFEATVRDAIRAAAHEAAHARLQWWRGEIDRWLVGRAEHPITRALASLVPAHPADAGLLHESLAAADLDLAHMTYGDPRELDAYLFRSGGAVQTVVACALAGERPLSATERDFARRLGSAVREVEMLRDFDRDLQAGRLYIPLSELDAVGIDPSDLAGLRTGEGTGLLMDRWARRVDAELSSLPGRLVHEERRTQRAGLVLAALHQRLLVRVRAADAAVRGRVEVPPMQRLWTAWRTALRSS